MFEGRAAQVADERGRPVALRVPPKVLEDVRGVRAAVVVAHVPPRRRLVSVHAQLVPDHGLGRD